MEKNILDLPLKKELGAPDEDVFILKLGNRIENE